MLILCLRSKVRRLRERVGINMSKIFITVLNMSFTASYCILAVIALRLLLRRLPKLFSYLLWSVVLFRLLCPVSISADYSLLRVNTHVFSAENITETNGTYNKNSDEEYTSYNNNAALPNGANTQHINDTAQADALNLTKQLRLPTVIKAASLLWLLVIIFLMLRSIVSTVKLRRFLGDAVRIEENIYEKKGIDTPFVIGIITPQIYLPLHLSESERKYVLAHEATHIARKDYIIKLLAYAAACIHWFNPLVWLAFSLMEKDMEMSCDESVLKKMGISSKENYSRTLLSLSSETSMLRVNPVAFSERKVKERVKNILSYRKKTMFTVVITAAAIAVVSLGLAINPKAESAARAWSDDSESNTEALNSKAPAALNDFIKTYANAFCDRDGNTIASLYIDEAAALADGEEMLLEKLDVGYSFGWSSPWPWFSNECRYLINESGQTADIWFYALTSDPHASVWKQKIHYTEKDGKYYIAEITTQFLDSISNKSEFDEAYLIGGEYSFVDYRKNGFAESVLFQIQDGSSSADYTVYGEPETAAEYILNLTGGVGTVQSSSDGTAVVEYTFADGSSVQIPMLDCTTYRPYMAPGTGASMIVPVDIYSIPHKMWIPGIPDL